MKLLKLPIKFLQTFAATMPLLLGSSLSAQNSDESLLTQSSNEEELPAFDEYLPEPPPLDSPPVQTSPTGASQAVPEGVPLQEEQIPEPAIPAIDRSAGAYELTDANLNDVFALLAENADRQYFHNPRIASEEFRVTGRLLAGNPLARMEELAFQYGLEMYEKGNTVYALTKDQMTDLPSKEWHYQLRYLRPSDIEGIKNLVQPYLSPGTGLVNYEPKTNTVIVIDTPQRIDRVENFFKTVDKPQGQVVVEIKILTVNSTAASRLGVNWAATLGESGLSISAAADLADLFGVASTGGIAGISTSDSNFVLSPFELDGVIRALNEGNLVTQNSNPVIITEDNEQATVSLIDRFPIITTTTTAGTGVSTQTEEVRYRIDESDPVGDPATTREIGITVAVTPQILPDGTIRIKMRPRSAAVVEEVQGLNGVFPRVAESSIETIARIPNGHSLLIGGFLTEATSKADTKVPILGDIPFLNFLFKSKEDTKESSSLIFVVTPTSYSPEDEAQNYATSNRVQQTLGLKPGHDHINPAVPGQAHESDYCRTMRAIRRDLSRDTENTRR